MSHSRREEAIYKAFYFQSLARNSALIKGSRDAWTPMACVTYSTQDFVFVFFVFAPQVNEKQDKNNKQENLFLL